VTNNIFSKIKTVMRTRSGYTLIEVLVAMLIFAVTMIFGFTFFMYGNRGGVSAKEMVFALDTAKSLIEDTKNMDYDTVKLNYPPPPGTAASPLEHIDPQSGVRYMSEITTVEDAAVGYLTIFATITWNSPGSGIRRELNLTTIKPAPAKD
jgi:prepilin-type N-terminal cleavage/methylation domain-containing protein